MSAWRIHGAVDRRREGVLVAKHKPEAIAKTLLQTAREFEKAAKIVGDYMISRLAKNAPDPPKPGLPFSVVVPTYVLDAFSAELYLKCLYLLEKGEMPNRIHKLDDLFDALPEDIQQLVGEAAEDTARLHDSIKRGANAFTEFRYSHEWWGIGRPPPTVSAYTLGEIARATQTVILARWPNLKETMEAVDVGDDLKGEWRGEFLAGKDPSD